jgi:hypothetical protein
MKKFGVFGRCARLPTVGFDRNGSPSEFPTSSRQAFTDPVPPSVVNGAFLSELFVEIVDDLPR